MSGISNGLPERGAGTPRRLAVGVSNLPDATPRVKKTVTGPPASVAFKDGKPTQAAIAFAQQTLQQQRHRAVPSTCQSA